MSEIIVRSTGAFSRWRQEIRAGLRTPEEPADALLFAALYDSIGLDRLDEGELHLAAIWFNESAHHALRWAKRQAA